MPRVHLDHGYDEWGYPVEGQKRKARNREREEFFEEKKRGHSKWKGKRKEQRRNERGTRYR